MACNKKYWIDETEVAQPIFKVDNTSPKKAADPKLVADVQAKIKKAHL